MRWPAWLSWGLGIGGVGLAAWAASRRFRLSAWTGRGALADPAQALATARAAGLSGLDLMVNDATGGADWHIYDRSLVSRAVDLWRAGGMDVSLTTWARPDPRWIDGIASELSPLAASLGVRGLNFDLEEPWTVPLRASGGSPEWTGRLFAAGRSVFRGPLGVTMIVYAPMDVLRPACESADVLIPQAYATVKNAGNLPPGGLERTAVERYRGFGKRIVLGAAAWNLEGAYGLSALSAFEASLAAARGLVSEVRFWRLEMLQGALARAAASASGRVAA